MEKLKIDTKKSKHHVSGWVIVDGRRVLPLHYSFGNKDLPDDVPDRFRRSMHLTVDEFNRFRVCTMSRDEYVKLLRQKGFLDP